MSWELLPRTATTWTACNRKRQSCPLTSNGFDYYIVSKDSAHWYENNLSLKVVNATDTLVLLKNAG